MLHLNLNIRPKTAKRLKKVLEFSRDEESFAQNVIAYQVAELKRGILNIKIDLKSYEEKYKMTSAGFYKQFTQGKLDDREDYILWAGLYELLDKNEKQLQGLTG
ncbi:MAG: hypothetical protein DPW18_08655 [Chloroflexi bacterium]|nr:hypothetical protein [Chloroflexota bacterium]MDL1941412.1 hypothetical protein [Chloroflexi bacterium CFX2]